MRRTKTKINIPMHASNSEVTRRTASFSAPSEAEPQLQEYEHSEAEEDGEHEPKMLSEKQQKKVVRKLFGINRYLFRSKLLPGQHSHAPPPLNLITAPPPPDSEISADNSAPNSSNNSHNRVLHYNASLGSLKSDLARARVLLDENRARETREATTPKGTMPTVPGWAELLLDYGYEYRRHNNNVNNQKKQKRQQKQKTIDTEHLLHLIITYCGCLQCLTDDVRSDDVPDSLGELDDIGNMGDINNISDNKLDICINRKDTAADDYNVDDDDVFHDESMGVFSHEIRRISTSNSDRHPFATGHSNSNTHPGAKYGGCSMGAKCVIEQGKECIFENSDQITLHQTPPRSAVQVPLPSDSALRALCDMGDTAWTEMELGTIRKGVASFSGQISKLNSTCCSVRPEEILRAASALYDEVYGKKKSRKESAGGRIVLRGTLYRFGMDAGIFPVPNDKDNSSEKAVAVVFRRQPFFILSGTICIPGKSMGEYVPSDLEVTLGFGEDNAGARDVFPDGSLGPPRNLCLNELLVHVPMHLRDDRWELILK